MTQRIAVPVVFISYSQVDSAEAEKVSKALEDARVNYFRDEKDIDWGDGITVQVREALKSVKAVVVIISPASQKSSWVPYEIGFAEALGCRILPYFTHPSLDVPGYMRDLKRLSSIQEVRDFFVTKFKELYLDSGGVKLPDVRVSSSPAITRIRGTIGRVVAIKVANHDAAKIFI